MVKKTLLAFAVFAGIGCAASKHASITGAASPQTAGTAALNDTLITNLLSRYPDYFDSLTRRPGQWNIQIIYTRIDRKANNKPVFTTYTYGSSPYFYPASTVKMPVAALALQRLHVVQRCLFQAASLWRQRRPR